MKVCWNITSKCNRNCKYCFKFNKDDLQHIKNTNIMARDANNGLFEVWHAVW